MTIEIRARTPSPAREDDPAPPVRRRPPPYAPRAQPQAATPTPAPARSAVPPARTRTREAQSSRQSDQRRDPPGHEPAGVNVSTHAAALRGHCADSGDDGAGTHAGAAGATGAGQACADFDAQAELEAGLHGLEGRQGIFELLLAGGQSIGVVVQSAPGSIHFLLSAGGGALEQRLRKNRMELERRLQQRMQKDVRIALL
ncbi:hypothetical protein INH39_30335 [Massilia violaceinigra]|uniref:Uncharacterized protein n=1 Tax=Massilia violaceinigra TaxID=2045208 RepID=A0ABY4A4D7_9BURK|nr:hypothetical protein [Massilia violaceinigra]UOD29635.1 hypothetical protein INH39_30335 [Massilia violaceinigra]